MKQRRTTPKAGWPEGGPRTVCATDEERGTVREGARLARPRSMYLPSEIWEAGRKRAKKRRMKISRIGWLCCERAARKPAAPAQPAGNAVALSAEDQQRLDADMREVPLLGSFMVSAADGQEATVLLQEVLLCLHLWEGGEGS